jgi:hypothetical protein
MTRSVVLVSGEVVSRFGTGVLSRSSSAIERTSNTRQLVGDDVVEGQLRRQQQIVAGGEEHGQASASAR